MLVDLGKVAVRLVLKAERDYARRVSTEGRRSASCATKLDASRSNQEHQVSRAVHRPPCSRGLVLSMFRGFR